VEEQLTPEQARVKIITDLLALPGPKPLKPIPPDLKAEVLAEIELESEEEVARQVEELRLSGGVSLEPLLAELDRMVEESK